MGTFGFAANDVTGKLKILLTENRLMLISGNSGVPGLGRAQN
jgi:hypothetical protein